MKRCCRGIAHQKCHDKHEPVRIRGRVHGSHSTDLLERIAQLGGRHHGFASTGRRQAAVLIQPASQEQQIGIDTVASSDDRHFLPWLKPLANQGQLLLWAPAAPPLQAQSSPLLSLLLVINITVCLLLIVRGSGVLSFLGLVH